MFKSLKAVAVAGAVALMSSSAFAAWDYFEVIEEGSAEAKVEVGNGGGDSWTDVKVRFGIIPNLEIMATNAAPFGMQSGFSLGARYQVLPEMLAAGVDFGIPTRREENIGLAPSVQFHMGINDMISLGAGAGLGIDINEVVSGMGTSDVETEVWLTLEFGLELGFQLTENFGLWVGCDFAMDLTYDEDDPLLRNRDTYGNGSDMVVTPGFGISYTAANITVGADFGIDLLRVNREGEDESLGLSAGVNFAIAF